MQVSIPMEQKEKILGPPPAPGTQVLTPLGGRCGLSRGGEGGSGSCSELREGTGLATLGCCQGRF